MSTKITSEPFGQTEDGQEVTRFTLTNSKGASVKILDYGGRVADINVPDKNGKMGDVSLGFDNIKDYEAHPLFFGGLCGRVANRIAGAEFTLDGKTHKLFVNNGPNTNHGGKAGFDQRMWKGEIKGDKLVVSYLSVDGEEHFPGDLSVEVTYSLCEDNSLKLEYKATTTKPTILNLTNHTYFNLAGHGAGHLDDHVITMYSDSYLPLDETGVPLGEVKKVDGTEYDLRSPVRMGDRLHNVPGGKGFDINFCLDNNGEMKLAARVEHPPSGRYLECRTTEPGLQLYSAFYIYPMTGKEGAAYGKYGGLCLEAQHYPDSIHKPDFPTTVLRPGETYTQTTIYKFGII
ncbi:galactose mutarotase [Aplysia californica]|uniref:Aldose 1-epimerase n=1 Tax=Aplysia californica TaxID=6500 RepID=A0ABM0JAF1_APLCA|nr:galactose mutarotase [Aplysia californica]